MGSVKTYRIFLDDIRDPIDAYLYTGFKPFIDDTEPWRIVRSYDQFVDYITRNFNKGYFPEIIAFDHDLAEIHYSHLSDIDYDKFTEKTGMDCAKWLVDFCMDNNLKLPEYYVHSMNPAGARNIISYLENYKKHEENV